jgi:endonuclease/exonuclease/phosphatase family metal-dependent hydrolase
VLALATRRWAAAALALIAAVALAAVVLPRAVGGPTEPEGEPGATLRVLAANMKVGKGDPVELMALVERLDVDVLAVEELPPKLADELRAAGLEQIMRGRALEAVAPGTFGVGLYAKTAISEPAAIDIPGPFPLVSGLVEVPGGPPLRVFAVHTQPPTRTWGSSWDDDLRALPEADEQTLQILMGDFNATLDHDELRNLLDRGYDDVAETLGDGLTPTWPEQRRFPPLVTIDHVLADERIGISDYSTHEIAGSDHRAVYAELLLPAPG